MKYRLTTFFVGLMLCMSMTAQQIEFEDETVDVGTTLWRKPVTGVFKFTNKDSVPLVVDSVDAGCGCMNAEWTRTAIDKNGRGEIEITYDAELLGRIDRIINVYTNASDKPLRVRMTGLVSTGEDADMGELYPYSIGDVMLSTDNVEFEDVHRGDSTTVSFEIFNGGSEVYTPQLMHLPQYVTAEYSPEMLGRGRRGTVTLTLHSDKIHNIGVNQANIYLARFPGDKVCDENAITLTSVLLPELPYSNSLLAPLFHISSDVIDLGVMGKKKKKSGKVTLTNNGRTALNIESIEVYNRALQVSLPTRTIAPGQSVKMKVTLHTQYLGQSKAQPRVLIITNDAKKQKATVTVKFQ